MIKPTIKLQELQARIGRRAKSAPAHRFWGLYVHIKKRGVIEASYLRNLSMKTRQKSFAI
jgi:RNA-directed DNA polymerase